MSDADWSERTIRDIVTSNPVAMQLFREHGIDFCCNGDRELAEAVDQLEISQKELYLALDAIREKGHPAGLPDYAGMTAGELLDSILSRHHAWLWDNLARIRSLLVESLRADGQRHPELYDMYKIFADLSGELEPHLVRQETEIAPLVVENRDPKRRLMLMHALAENHAKTMDLTRKLRRAANGYALPPEADETRRDLYQLLTQLDERLHDYVHLENNLLFPKLDEERNS